jgi:integration host factor subunit beta
MITYITRKELILKLSDKLPQHEVKLVEAAVKQVLYTIADTLIKNRRVEIRGFGAFTIRKSSARISRNPKTGEQITIPAKKRLHFKPGKALKTRVDYDRI